MRMPMHRKRAGGLEGPSVGLDGTAADERQVAMYCDAEGGWGVVGGALDQNPHRVPPSQATGAETAPRSWGRPRS